VASLRLVSPGAVTDGVTLLLPQKTDNLFFSFLVIALKSDDLLLILLQTTITTRTLSTFLGDRLSSILVNSPAKYI